MVYNNGSWGKWGEKISTIFRYRYDNLQRRIQMEGNGAVTSYSYDKADRLVSINLPSSRSVDVSYDAASRRTNIARSNGLNTQTIYNTPASNGETTGLLETIGYGLDASGNGGSSLNQLLGSFSYRYNQKANITAITESGSVNRSRNYTLDPIERLTKVTNGEGASLETYTLDEEGNRINSHLASFHVTTPANRVTEDEKFQFEYDINGNLIRETNKISAETWQYEYSVYDELVRATKQGGSNSLTDVHSIEYGFDAFGRRYGERLFNTEGALLGGANFYYDGNHLAYEETVNTDSLVVNKKWYTHSNYTDDLIALTLGVNRYENEVSPTYVGYSANRPSIDSYYYHTDHQSSVRALTDENGQVVNEYTYDAYGNVETRIEGIEQRFNYTGRAYDQVTGLYHYRARAYDPSTGRFMQEDPIWFSAGDLNVHRYVWNNPVNWNDPSGLTATITYGRAAAVSAVALARLPSFGAIASRYTTRFGLNALGRAYFLKTAKHNLERLASGEGTLGDLIATQFAGIGAVLHQAKKHTKKRGKGGAGAGAGAGSGAGASGGSPDGKDPYKATGKPGEGTPTSNPKGWEKFGKGRNPTYRPKGGGKKDVVMQVPDGIPHGGGVQYKKWNGLKAFDDGRIYKTVNEFGKVIRKK